MKQNSFEKYLCTVQIMKLKFTGYFLPDYDEANRRGNSFCRLCICFTVAPKLLNRF